MNSVQESKNELEAAIRYAENAISAAQSTIESMEFRQEMAKKNYQEQTGREEALQREVDELKAQVNALEQPERATMPVIPKEVAIAIFREGMAYGVSDAADYIQSESITIEETEYPGDFEISFSRQIDLSEELDLDWMRSKVGDYSEQNVIDALQGLCAEKKFECRIHGIDDQQTKDND